MKDKSILFSGPMIRAILNENKTMTRRVMKPQYDVVSCFDGRFCSAIRTEDDVEMGDEIKCPYEVGQKLWVRETWWFNEGLPVYRADAPPEIEKDTGWWKPSIFMPRKYSRITLEVTDIRAERLQEITEEDCWAEGIKKEVCLDCDALSLMHLNDEEHYYNPIPKYRKLWDKLNAKRGFGWDTSPWVWVVSFKMVNQ